MKPTRSTPQFLSSRPNGDDLLADNEEISRALKIRDFYEGMQKGIIPCLRNLTRGARKPSLPRNVNLTAVVRAKVSPLVNGLFPHPERIPVITLLERSVVFLTGDNIYGILRATPEFWPAYHISGIYIDSLEPEAETGKEPVLMGFTYAGTAYISARYFSNPRRFTEPIVHEAAHLLHTCGRDKAGLPHAKASRSLLDIRPDCSEIFAYACEAYSCILESKSSLAGRKELLDEYVHSAIPAEEMVDQKMVNRILSEGISAPNGWEKIASLCSISQPEAGQAG
jgi:hypothetical protein